jgi:3-oxoacyl-[acyl-carrier protein] reductase
VLVTGGSRGIGRHLALAVARAGARVAIVASQPSEALDTARAAIAAVVGADGVLPIVADVRDPLACERAVREAVARFGRLDALVNNAGVGMRHISETFNTAPPRFWEVPVAPWRDIVETNLFGAFHMGRAAAPAMVARGAGRIVNIGTSPVTMIRKGYSPYGPSKAALEAMTRIWSQDLEGTGVTANLLLPGGATDTDFLPGTGAARKGADGMLLAPDILDAPLVWLVSDAAADVNGRRIVGRLWDKSLPPDAAAAGAMQPPAGMPSIL